MNEKAGPQQECVITAGSNVHVEQNKLNIQNSLILMCLLFV